MYLGIYGAGNLGKELYDIALRVNNYDNKWEKIIFLDDFYKEKTYYLSKVFKLSDFYNEIKNIEIVIANGTPYNRKLLYDKVKAVGGRLAGLYDPTAIVSPTARLGEGVILKPFVQVLSNAIVGDNVLIQSYVDVSHDNKIGNHCSISTEVCFGGKTVIEDEVFIGLGCAIRECVHIGKNAIVGMGAVVTKDVAPNTLVIGNPARVTGKAQKDFLNGQEGAAYEQGSNEKNNYHCT